MINELLLWIIATPFIGAILVALSGRWANLRDSITIATAATLLWLVLGQMLPAMLAGDDLSVTLMPIVEGLTLRFSIEPLGMLFAGIASLLWLVTSFYAFGYMRGAGEAHQTRFFACFAIAIGSAMAIALADNLLTLFIFYEVLTLSTYPLVTHKGNDAARAGGRTYLSVLLITSIGLQLPAIVWLYLRCGTLDFTMGGIIAGKGLDTLEITILLLLFVFGVGKAAVMPMHRWLPAAMVAPTPVSALLHAVAVVKAGVFTLIKVVLMIFGADQIAALGLETWLTCLTGFTVIAASVVALRQTNIKRMLAYSTISQLSYIVMAALTLTPLHQAGAAVHLTAHAFGKITLFFVAGAIYVASKKSELTDINGIGRRMPITMTAFALAALSMMGVPPSAGFISKWYMMSGAFQNELYLLLGVLAVSTALNAAYFLPVVFNAFFKEEDVPPKKEHGEAPALMLGAIIVTASLTLLFFFFNGPVVGLEKGLLGVK